jgi:SAM-dependent methyltransferase
VERYAVPLRIVRCGVCRHVYLDPRPADADLGRLYDEEYYRGGGDYSYADDREQGPAAALRAEARLARIERLVRPGRLLEVGCSFGAFLLAARRRGWEVAGIDLSPYAVAAGRELGLDVREGTLESAPPPPGRTDVVYLAETVEHLSDPRATMRAAAAALRPGGIVVAATANHASLARLLRGRRWGYYMPGHLQYFTASSLSRLLADAGMPVVLRRFGDDRSLASLAAARRAAGERGGARARLRDLLVRLHLRGRSLGAGMVQYGRKVESA